MALKEIVRTTHANRVISAGAYDLGTTNGKPHEIWYIRDNSSGYRFAVFPNSWGADAWTTNTNGVLRLPQFYDPCKDNSILDHSCWFGDTLKSNISPSEEVYAGDKNIYASSGASGTPVAVFRRENNELLAIFLEKSLSNIPLDSDHKRVLERHGITKLDPMKQLNKVAVLPQIWDSEIRKAIKTDARFKDIYVLPLTSALLQNGLCRAAGTFGWTLADIRGITNGKDDLQLAYDLFVEMGYVPDMNFFIQEHDIVKLGPDAHAIIGGDFQTNVEFIFGLGNRQNPKVDLATEVFGELDSMIKFFKSNQNKRYIPSLSKPNGLRAEYGMLRDGAGMNRELIKLCAPELVGFRGDKYKYVNDIAAAEVPFMSTNPFLFIPHRDGDGKGQLLFNRGGGWEPYSYVEAASLKKELRDKLILATYLGIGCMSRHMLGDIPTLVVYGGFIQEDQLEKLGIFVACLSEETQVDILYQPDSGGITAINGMNRVYGNVDASELVTRVSFGRGGSFSWYYNIVWEPVFRQLNQEENNKHL